jgi:hypothetical protein
MERAAARQTTASGCRKRKRARLGHMPLRPVKGPGPDRLGHPSGSHRLTIRGPAGRRLVARQKSLWLPFPIAAWGGPPPYGGRRRISWARMAARRPRGSRSRRRNSARAAAGGDPAPGVAMGAAGGEGGGRLVTSGTAVVGGRRGGRATASSRRGTGCCRTASGGRRRPPWRSLAIHAASATTRKINIGRSRCSSSITPSAPVILSPQFVVSGLSLVVPVPVPVPVSFRALGPLRSPVGPWPGSSASGYRPGRSSSGNNP